MLEYRREDHRLHINGLLNEQVSMRWIEELANTIRECHTATGKRVVLNVSGIIQGNSTGLIRWIQTLRKLDVPIAYEQVPIWMTEQFSEIIDFFRGDVTVHSVQACYYPPNSEDDCIIKTLVLGVDVPYLDDYIDYEAPQIVENGKTYAPDFDGDYFFFMTSLTPKAG